MEVDEGSDQKSARLKNEFTEDEKCHNLMSWFNCYFTMKFASAYLKWHLLGIFISTFKFSSDC